MPGNDSGGGWDFDPVIDLIRSFTRDRTIGDSSPAVGTRQGSNLPEEDAQAEGRSTLGLGNFDELWKYLGCSPVEKKSETLDSQDGEDNERRAWQDEAGFADDDEKNRDGQGLRGLTKGQRKRARRKEKKINGHLDDHNHSVSSSSSEDEPEQDLSLKRSLQRKAIIQDILARPLPASDDEAKSDQNGSAKKASTSFDERWPVARPRLAPSRPQTLRPDNSLTTAAERKTKLMIMLKERFIEERPFLTNMNLFHYRDLSAPYSDQPQEGIHVFIDASNITIGFHDTLKTARSLPPTTRLRRQPIEFHSLALILCRGRPTAKRVVAGSDSFPEMAEAKALGYETNILDRVHKAKELTPQQRKYAAEKAGSGLCATSAGSGSETNAAYATVAVAKWTEQAVDEILHLKMMESIVDATEPSTMVLASGDAAKAEYSDGFLKMVERALSKGWKVELACWSQNMSSAYKRREFRMKWDEQFKVVDLDDFVELLLGSDSTGL